MSTKTVRIVLELEADLAAALHRFMDKANYAMARAVLYPHVAADIRADQAREIMEVTAQVQKALEDSGVSGWPWVETGKA